MAGYCFEVKSFLSMEFAEIEKTSGRGNYENPLLQIFTTYQ